MRFKKIISGILTFAIILGTVPQINAEAPIAVSESAGMSLSEENMQISGTNSFGNMVAQELAEVSSEQEANNGCNVFSVEMSGKTASVSFDTLQDSAIVVAIYDNEGMKMITSGYKEVTAEETETEVKISGTIPQYFYIRAYLVNPDTLRPLSTEYNSPMYTREMQEFLSKTTADFDPDRVLNLDDNPDTNFAVFSEDTTLIHENGKTNVVSADEAALTYVFENPDDDLLTLDVGRVFAFEYNGELVILKAVTVKKNIDEDSGKMTSVTVVGQEAELEEAFEHLRIDGEANTDKAEIDYSNMGEGITCDGLIEDVDNEEDEFSINAIDIDIEGKTSKSIKFNIEEKGNIGSLNEFNFSASINLKLEPSTKLYLSFSEIYIEFKLDYSAKVTIEFEIKGTFLSKELPLAYIMIPIIPEVLNMSITPAFVIELSGKATLEGKLSGTVGFKVSQDGIENLTSSPKFSAKAGIEVTIFIGFSLKPQLFLIHESIVDMNLKAKVGVEIKVEKRLSTDDMDNTVRHECNSCIDGEIKGKYTIDFTVKLLDLQQLEFKVSLLDISAHISDFYFSFTFNEFAFSNCPHYEYLTNIKVVNNACDSIHKANITIDEDDSNVLVTNVLGNVQVWLAKGNHDVKITADGYMSRNASVNINTGGQSFRVIIKKSSDMSTSDFFGGILDDFKSGSSNPNDLDYGKAWDLIVKYVSLGEANSAAITLDGSLYMWGFNRYGEIGDGTWEDKSVPIKIMDNVSSVSLGGHRSAAITTDGSLYMWGDNHYGQLGDGTWESKSVPIKIMDNVSSVSLGYDHSAAITTDGSLYMWGYNDHGQLGDGTIKNKSVPIKIMDNISSVSLGYDHSAAITYDGSLYMWGNNSSGQLGDGTSENRSVPVKIMNNVSFVSLGRRFSAAITADRNLCMWGSNHYGQIGDGTRMINKKVPVEIMDNVFSVSLGSSHSAAITADGNFYMWGCNEFGELGNGTTANSLIPIKVNIPIIEKNTVPNFYYASNAPAIITSLLTNEIYNIYSVGSRTSSDILSPTNLIYIAQAASDSSGTLAIPQEVRNVTVFVKAMHEFDVYNAPITSAEVNNTSVSLVWEPLQGASEYEVYCYTTDGILSQTKTSATSLAINNLEKGKYYGFLVTSIIHGEQSVPAIGDVRMVLIDNTLIGDVNADSKVNDQDSILLSRYLAEWGNTIDTAAADMNGDGKINDQDSIVLSRTLAGWYE